MVGTKVPEYNQIHWPQRLAVVKDLVLYNSRENYIILLSWLISNLLLYKPVILVIKFDVVLCL